MIHKGSNLPPTQGTTNSGAFIPGVYSYDYSNVAEMTSHGFNSLRLPINIATANCSESLEKLKGFVNAIGGNAVICMFESSSEHIKNDGHGRGRVHDAAEIAAAWVRIHNSFAAIGGVMYEIFNEPFGYDDPVFYLEEMRNIISLAQLPVDRCILDGFGYASDVRILANLGWDGFLGYHFYPWWLSEGSMTQENFSQKLQADLQGLATRVFITEVGSALDQQNDAYEEYMADGTWQGGNVNCLRGFHDGVLALQNSGQPVAGVFHWHGWNNGDSYDFWHEKNIHGAAKIRKIMADLEKVCVVEPITSMSKVPVHVFRKEEMTYLAHNHDVVFRQMSKWNWKYERICFHAWPDLSIPGLEPIYCLRKGEVALYCHKGWERWETCLREGWREEKIAFYAYAPNDKLENATPVHEWRKGELTYYTTKDWHGWESMVAWGWSYARLAFHA